MSLMSTRPNFDGFSAESSPRSPDQNAFKGIFERRVFWDRPAEHGVELIIEFVIVGE